MWGRAVVHNLANPDGWEYFEGQTPVMPSKAVLGKLPAVIQKGCVGRVRVDDFMFRPLGTKAVEFVASSRYRDEGWEGTVDFHVLQHVNTVKHPLATLKGTFYCAARGGTRALPDSSPTVGTAFHRRPDSPCGPRWNAGPTDRPPDRLMSRNMFRRIGTRCLAALSFFAADSVRSTSPRPVSAGVR